MARLRLCATVMVAAMLSSACGSNSTPQQGGSAPSVGSSSTGSESGTAGAHRFDGVTLNVAAESDQYAAVMQKLAGDFKAATGATVNVDILGYPEEYSKITADFVGHTANYDLVAMDIVWSGEFAANDYTVDLKPLIDRDAKQINLGDFYDVDWTLGGWKGKQVAFPMAGYAMLLNYNKPAFDAAGLQAPKTMDELKADAQKLTNPAKNVYGITVNGQKGAAGAQDWMTYNSQMGGKLIDADGKPTINSPTNVQNLAFFKSLFQFAPPGAFDYDWNAREQSFKQGIAMMQVGASIARPNYDDPSQSKIVGKVGTTIVPAGKGMQPVTGFEGWGLGINKDSKKQDAAWEYIKWLTSEKVQKKWIELGAGAYIRKSTLRDPELLAKYPWQKMIDQAFQNGNGDFRPRVPQYSQIQDILGTSVNEVLHGTTSAQQALDQAQTQIEPLFK